MTVIQAGSTVTKQELGREPLERWRNFANLLKIEVKKLLKLGRKKNDPRMKFLARVLEPIGVREPNSQLKDISDEDKAFKAEDAREGVSDCEEQTRLISGIWKLISENTSLGQCGDPFIKERMTYASILVNSYQAGTLCFEYKNMVTNHNNAVIALNRAYEYVSVKDKKPKKVKQSLEQVVPMESCAVAV